MNFLKFFFLFIMIINSKKIYSLDISAPDEIKFKRQINFIYVNGIRTENKEANTQLKLIEELVNDKFKDKFYYDDKKINFDLGYIKTNGAISDFLDSYKIICNHNDIMKSKISTSFCDNLKDENDIKYNFENLLLTFEKILKNNDRKFDPIYIVSYSQGNLYANLLCKLLKDRYGIKQPFYNLQIASPTNNVECPIDTSTNSFLYFEGDKIVGWLHDDSNGTKVPFSRSDLPWYVNIKYKLKNLLSWNHTWDYISDSEALYWIENKIKDDISFLYRIKAGDPGRIVISAVNSDEKFEQVEIVEGAEKSNFRESEGVFLLDLLKENYMPKSIYVKLKRKNLKDTQIIVARSWFVLTGFIYPSILREESICQTPVNGNETVKISFIGMPGKLNCKITNSIDKHELD